MLQIYSVLTLARKKKDFKESFLKNWLFHPSNCYNYHSYYRLSKTVRFLKCYFVSILVKLLVIQTTVKEVNVSIRNKNESTLLQKYHKEFEMKGFIFNQYTPFWMHLIYFSTKTLKGLWSGMILNWTSFSIISCWYLWVFKTQTWLAPNRLLNGHYLILLQELYQSTLLQERANCLEAKKKKKKACRNISESRQRSAHILGQQPHSHSHHSVGKLIYNFETHLRL